LVSYSDINLLAVVAAAIASMALGFIWYHPAVFGKPWLRLIGKRQEDLGNPGPAYALTALGSLLAAAATAVVLEGFGARDLTNGVGIGALLGVGIVAPVLATDHVFSGRPIPLYLLNVAYHVVSFIVMGAILGAWQ
jgi:hypothetical protein